MGYKILYLTLFAIDDKLSPILKRIGLNGSNRVNSKEEYTSNRVTDLMLCRLFSWPSLVSLV